MKQFFNQKNKQIALILGDILVFYLSLYLTLLIRYKGVSIGLWKSHFLPFSIIFIIWFLVFYINDLYDLRVARNNVDLYGRMFKSIVINIIAASVFFYFISGRFITIRPQKVLLILAAVFTLFFFAFRRIYNKFLVSPALTDNILFIGVNKNINSLVKEIIHKPQLGYTVKAIASLTPDQAVSFDNIEIINHHSSIQDAIIKHSINVVVIDSGYRNNSELIEQLYNLLNKQIAFHDLPRFYEMITGKIPVDSISQIWFLENLMNRSAAFYGITKRIYDCIIAALLLIISLPFSPVIYLIAKAQSKDTGFFTQTRVGKNGKVFLAIKFRSMYIDSEKDGPQWAQKNDPRVTPFGKFMRKTRIDEIPQLINVLKGDMSFVGPRPERPEFVKELSNQIPFYKERLIVKPGITGWAQVNFPYGASTEDAMEKLQYDLYYIKNRSIMLDVSILLKTIKTVLMGGGQ